MTYVPKPSRLGVLAILATLSVLASACGGSATNETSGSDHSEHADHALYEVPEGTPVPTISISVEPDPVSGANLYVETTNYIISPEHASTEAVPGEGHFHVYVDGEKTARFYNEAMHLALDEGEHTVMVELSANDHSPYAVDGVAIMATETITIEPAGGDHGHPDPAEAVDPVPTISLSATPDPKSGWNLFADITAFEFAPEKAGHENVDGQGHIHLYVDGEKKGRLYGPWWHLGGLSAGTHEVTVELTANNHAPLLHNGSPISSTVTIEVSEDQASDAMDGHDNGHEHDHSGDGAALLDIDAADADVVIELTVLDGKVDIDSDRFEVDEGATVGIIATADAADKLHVHGYEVLQSLDENNPINVAFTADVSGSFEVELEDSGQFLFDLLVR